MSIQDQGQTFQSPRFWRSIKPESYRILIDTLFQIMVLSDHSGMVELSKLMLLSRCSNLVMSSLYLLSLNISSALCMLKEQHMPRSVGNMLNMLEQFSLLPFQEHHFRSPTIEVIQGSAKRLRPGLVNKR